MNHDWGGVAVH